MITAMEQYNYFIEEKIKGGKLIEVDPKPYSEIVYITFGTGKFFNRFVISKLKREDILYLNYLTKEYSKI